MNDGWFICFIDYTHQKEELSWFPKGSMWDSSGRNHGYWTADNEDFYQRRLETIRSGGKPLSTKEWKTLLRDVRPGPVNKFKNAMSNVCDKFLQGDMSYWAA